jgi:hypothetical protein
MADDRRRPEPEGRETRVVKIVDWLARRGLPRRVLPSGISSGGLREATLPEPRGPAREGRQLIAPDPEPSPEPVEANQLLDDLVVFVRRFVVLPEHAVVAVVLWILHTWVLDAFGRTPFLCLTSPVQRCGKSSVMRVLELLCRRAMLAANLTASVLFRAVDQHHPTLLVDEGDTFVGRSPELRGIVNAGNARNAVVWRADGPGHSPRGFSVWSAKAFASIGPLAPTVMDRSVVIPMQRKSPRERVEDVLQPGLEADDHVAGIRRRAARWAADNVGTLGSLEPGAPTGLDDRARDNWTPLLAVAEACGGLWPERARAAATALSAGRFDEDEAAIVLLGDLRDLFAARAETRLPTQEILVFLTGLEERPWKTWRGSPSPRSGSRGSCVRSVSDPAACRAPCAATSWTPT